MRFAIVLVALVACAACNPRPEADYHPDGREATSLVIRAADGSCWELNARLSRGPRMFHLADAVCVREEAKRRDR